MKVILDSRWIDLGELGQHQAVIVGDVKAYGEFSFIDEVNVGKINIRPLIPNDLRDILIDECLARRMDQVKSAAEAMIREAA